MDFLDRVAIRFTNPDVASVGVDLTYGFDSCLITERASRTQWGYTLGVGDLLQNVVEPRQFVFSFEVLHSHTLMT